MEGGAAVSHLTEEAAKRVWFINLPEEVEAVTPQDRIAELERENAALRDVIEQWKCRYYDVADAICRESNGPQDLCRQAWALRADKQRLDWLDQNMTAGASFETFQKTVPIGETRKAIDEAMRKEAQP
jgi:hypothetical protein